MWRLGQPVDMAATPALRKALSLGISSGHLVDTKIILYSHRDSSGRVCRPKALYTNSDVLKTVRHFCHRESTATLGFAHLEPHGIIPKVFFTDSQSKDFSEEGIDEEGSAEDYGYLSDSDLEDDEDERVVSSKRARKQKIHAFDPFEGLTEDRRVPWEEHEERVEERKVIRITDVAFIT